jgi:membrane protease YdiL (CAAX protease family)
MPERPGVVTASQWLKLLFGFLLVFSLFQFFGHVLASDRGQSGVAIMLVVVVALVVVEMALFGGTSRAALSDLGFGWPAGRGMVVALLVCAILMTLLPAIFSVANAPLALRPDWLLLLPGLFAQAGIAEETLFRGYLFRHLAARRGFWRAALLSMLPFVAAHLFLFAMLPAPVAVASIALSVAISFPFAHLFVIGGGTLWAPALVHFVVQGAIKVVVIPEEQVLIPALWIGAAALVPYLAFAFGRRDAIRDP